MFIALVMGMATGKVRQLGIFVNDLTVSLTDIE